jgi:hypothetical protein
MEGQREMVKERELEEYETNHKETRPCVDFAIPGLNGEVGNRLLVEGEAVSRPLQRVAFRNTSEALALFASRSLPLRRITALHNLPTGATTRGRLISYSPSRQCDDAVASLVHTGSSTVVAVYVIPRGLRVAG